MINTTEKHVCPECGKSFTVEDLNDYLSVEEFYISGMCQACQDEAFDNCGDAPTLPRLLLQ